MFNMSPISSLLTVIPEFTRGYVPEKYYNEHTSRSGSRYYFVNDKFIHDIGTVKVELGKCHSNHLDTSLKFWKLCTKRTILLKKSLSKIK